jgi:hypothetical protein
LLERQKFADRRQNSVDPISNEFAVQAIETKGAFMRRCGFSGRKSAIFAAFAASKASI